MALPGLSVTVQKLFSGLPGFHSSCWLLFHNIVWVLTSVNSENVLYPFVLVIVDFFRT
jgi:hypothetical protein